MNQHHADAIASLRSRAIDQLGAEPALAEQFARGFIEAMSANGWRPFQPETVREQHTKAADPERVKALLADFRSKRPLEDS